MAIVVSSIVRVSYEPSIFMDSADLSYNLQSL